MTSRLQWLAATAANAAPVDIDTDETVIARQRERAAVEQREVQAARWDRICPERFPDVEWGLLDQPAATVNDLRDWVDATKNGASGNLIILGGLGAGKTYAGLVVARELHMHGWRILFRPIVELLEDLRYERNIDPRVFTEPDLLIIDDLGGEKATEWTLDRLYLVVNRRWLDCKPTVVTSNLEPVDLRVAIGARTYDRLRHNATAIGFAGESRRSAPSAAPPNQGDQ